MGSFARTLKETEALAKEFVRKLSPSKGATVVGLYGNLGAGKTAFVKAIAKSLGIKETVTSPTFVIEKIYELKGKKFSRLIHIDAYRLVSHLELEAIGFKEIKKDPKNLIMIEWPENVIEALPKKFHRIDMRFINEKSRLIKIKHV